MIHFFHSAIIFFLGISVAHAQSASPEGTWEGKLQAGQEITMLLHLSKDSSGHWTALMDSPDQGVRNIPCGTPRIWADSVWVPVPSVHGEFYARLENESTLRGEWRQGRSFPLLLHKTLKPTEPPRPQTPHPPFPYLSDSVQYTGHTTGIRYGATITRPKGPGPFPAIILITGSGPQNRNEEIFSHQPFAVLADYLTRQGFMVLRADDRGVGATGGHFSGSTTADFEQDAEAHLDYLLSLPETDRRHIGLLGHSEGGLIAPWVASRRPGDVSFIIMLAGPGIPIARLMADQNLAILKKAGINAKAAEAYSLFYADAVPALAAAPDSDSAFRLFQYRFNRWRQQQPAPVVMATTGVTNDSSALTYCRAMVSQVYSAWFRYFIQYDPRPVLEHLQCSVLALNGGADIQVPAAENLAGIGESLGKSQAKHVEIQMLPGLNHLFQECRRCTVQEYGQLTQTMAPAVLESIGSWLRQVVR